jgi:hypothetical protein
LDDYVIRLSHELEIAEKGLNSDSVDESDILKAKKQGERAGRRMNSIDSSINTVSAVICKDVTELEKATSQFRCLSWCINGLATQVDELTTRKLASFTSEGCLHELPGVDYLFKEIEEINVENEAFRPWKGKGADEAVFSNSTTG